MTALVLFGTLILMLLIGVPISVSLGAATMVSLLTVDVPLAVIPQRMFTALDSVSIMAIPFFVLAGNLMTEGGISRRLVDFCNSIIGNVRGGMAYAMVLACAFFAALSGSAPATVLAIGGMLYPGMIRIGYPPARCAGLLAVSGGLGPIIPPSIIMVVYCTITNSSVGDMFKGGIVAGIMISIVLVILCIIYANKEKWPKNTVKLSAGQLFRSFFSALPALLLPVIILGGIYSGLMTPTESAAVAVIYSFIVGVFVYKEIRTENLYRILLESGKSSAMMLFIIATSTAFSWLFTFSGISGQMVDVIVSMHLAPWLFCLIVALILLVFGTFLEGIAICVLLVPVLWPIAQSLGVHAIHFGMIMCTAIVIGNMTPPVAVNLFAAASVSKLKMGEIAKGELPFFLGFVGVFFLFVFIPGLSTLLIG
ncbi:TRAP transporter large permease [Anaerotruncus rubiinfantis]|uniref:TRAP transporter large permease n=1 Tax=Anaerotruncus rubiinfantis TaxID=1720200 RepID=UPI0008315B37|nr:TRAP transporter large permease [Anaerotruncus rubiinfantis]